MFEAAHFRRETLMGREENRQHDSFESAGVGWYCFVWARHGSTSLGRKWRLPGLSLSIVIAPCALAPLPIPLDSCLNVADNSYSADMAAFFRSASMHKAFSAIAGSNLLGFGSDQGAHLSDKRIFLEYLFPGLVKGIEPRSPRI